MKKQWTLCACILAFAVGCGGGVDETLTEEAYRRLDAFVESALSDAMTGTEAEENYTSLSDAEREYVNSLVQARIGEPEHGHETDDALGQFPNVEAQAVGAAWQESIENVWTWNYPAKLFSTNSYVDWNCDDDPSDKEYVFYYPFPSVAPSAVRWTSVSSQVYLVFMAAYGGNLLGFGYNYGEVRLCIGDQGVAAAGGAAKVKSSIFIHY